MLNHDPQCEDSVNMTQSIQILGTRTAMQQAYKKVMGAVPVVTETPVRPHQPVRPIPKPSPAQEFDLDKIVALPV